VNQPIYAVTGATGWLGQASVAYLRARGDRVVTFDTHGRGTHLALRELPSVHHDVLLHFAYVTQDRAASLGWERYTAANKAITAIVIEAIGRHQPDVFFASSGAAEQSGALEINAYAALKRTDEVALRAAAGGRCAVARVYNVAGPYVTKPDIFLLTDLVTQSLRHAPLRLTSRRPTFRSYVDVEDIARWAVSYAGTDCRASTRGEVDIEAQQLAEAVLEASGASTVAQILRPDFDPDLPADRYIAPDRSWARSCAQAEIPMTRLSQQITRTMNYLRPVRD
jgi:UDP-glucuronate decarboxylase